MRPSSATSNGAPVVLGAGEVLRLVRAGESLTRADIARRTGMARSTVAQRVDALLAQGLLHETGNGVSTGGRPAVVLGFNAGGGVVLAAALGATSARLAVSDLAGRPCAEAGFDLSIGDGPEAVLAAVDRHFEALLRDCGRAAHDVRGIGIGVPGPVAFGEGSPVNPPIMPGWDGVSIPDWFRARYDTPVLVDNDVNVMAIGEHRSDWPRVEHLLFVKVGTGIACGIIAARRVLRGAQGAAGDIGHVQVSSADGLICRCGNVGCLEAVAGGRALAQRLTEAGIPAAGSRDVVRLVRTGNAAAGRAVREAGRALGEVLAACVNFFNPEVVVLGGDLADAHEQLLAGVREITIQRSLPLATRDVRMVPSRLGDQAGVVGATALVIEHVLAPHAVDRAIVHGAALPG